MANMRLLTSGLACAMLGLSDAAALCITKTGAAWAVDAAATSANCTTANGQWIGEASQESFSVDSPWSSPKRKTWWTKRLVKDEHRLYFGGRPSVRDVKYLYEQGYDAVYYLLGGEGGGTLGDEAQATTAEEQATAAEAGLLFAAAPVTTENAWNSAAVIDDLTAFIDFALANTNGPIYIHCGSGFASSAALQMYRLRKDAALTARPMGSTIMTVQGAIDEVAVHGFDISGQSLALSREAGVAAAEATAPTDHGNDQINAYHWMKYLGSFGDVKMFDAGQIHSTHIEAAKAAGIKVVVNMRKDSTSQEETNLLNLGSAAKTKNAAIEGPPAIPEVMRTDSAALFENYPQWVTESTRPTSWVGDVNGAFNFESTNALEFGDSVGYNSDTEKAAWEAAGVTYVHIPIGHGGKDDYSAAKLLASSDVMIKAINDAQAAGGHVLWHCRTGYRTGAFPSALFAVINGDGADAVGDRMAKLGYDFTGNLANLINAATTDLECPDCVVAATGAVTGTFQYTAAAQEEVDAAAAAAEAAAMDNETPKTTSAAAAVVPCAAALLAAAAFWA